MPSGCRIGDIHCTSRHPGRGSPLHELLSFTERCIFSMNRPTPTRYPALLTVVPKSHDLCKIKGSCITISDWVILFLTKYENL